MSLAATLVRRTPQIDLHTEFGARARIRERRYASMVGRYRAGSQSWDFRAGSFGGRKFAGAGGEVRG